VESILEDEGVVELAGPSTIEAGSVLSSVDLRVSSSNERLSVTVGESFGEALTCKIRVEGGVDGHLGMVRPLRISREETVDGQQRQ
jgi:hypothetical protein